MYELFNNVGLLELFEGFGFSVERDRSESSVGGERKSIGRQIKFPPPPPDGEMFQLFVAARDALCEQQALQQDHQAHLRRIAQGFAAFSNTQPKSQQQTPPQSSGDQSARPFRINLSREMGRRGPW